MITDEARDLILEEAYEPQYGARPIQRYISRVIGTQLSKMIIGGEVLLP